MNIIKTFKALITEKLFNVKWKCNGCGKENFDGGYFCAKCESELPYIGDTYCNNCGRKLKSRSNYCSTCKELVVSLDKVRSVFEYKEPISKLIRNLKYSNDKYLFELFNFYLEKGYKKYGLTADYITFVPSTVESRKKRGYNQSQILAEDLSKKVNVPVFYGVKKVRETERQAKLDKQRRVRNVAGAYRIVEKKTIKDKTVMIVDDVTTTGATLEALAGKIKKAGAKSVIAYTVASVSPKEGY